MGSFIVTSSGSTRASTIKLIAALQSLAIGSNWPTADLCIIEFNAQQRTQKKAEIAVAING